MQMNPILLLLAAALPGAHLSGISGPDGATAAVMQAILPSVNDLIAREPGNSPAANPMYARETQAPMVWIHLRKALPIAVDKEFYDISTVPGTTLKGRADSGDKKPVKIALEAPVQSDIPVNRASFLQTRKVDPVMIQNGLYLSMPLRQPPQETVNVAAVEDTRTIQAVADYVRKKREIARLEKSVTDFIKSLVVPPTQLQQTAL